MSSRQPLPKSCSTGTPERAPTSTNSAVVGAWVKPITRKLDAWTDSIAPVLSSDGVCEIGCVGSVRRADFHKLRAALP